MPVLSMQTLTFEPSKRRMRAGRMKASVSAPALRQRPQKSQGRLKESRYEVRKPLLALE